MFIEITSLIVISGFVGILAGIFGIGGGVIIVPTLQVYLSYTTNLSKNEVMLSSIATSLFIMIFTSLANAWLHYRKKNIDFNIVKQMSFPLVIGTFIGFIIVTNISDYIFEVIFTILLFIIAILMIFSPNKTLINKPPKLIFHLAGIIIGLISNILGIGTATVGITTFIALNVPIKKAIGNITCMNLFVAIPGSLFLLYKGRDMKIDLSYSVGYIYLLAAFIIIPIIAFFIPYGQIIARRMDQRLLKKLFGLLVLSISLKHLIDLT